MKHRRAGLLAAFILMAAPGFAPAQNVTEKPARPGPAVQAEIDRIVAADAEGYLAVARKNYESSPTIVRALAIGADQIAAGNPGDAEATINQLSGRNRTAANDNLAMWIALAREGKSEALQQAALARARLSKTLGAIAPALIQEASGDLQSAAAAYDNAIGQLDTTPLPPPTSREAVERLLEAPRIAHAAYRAAQVNHRLRRTDEAVKYYLLSEQFAPNAPDAEANLVRVQSGQPPFEPALTQRSALGQWLLLSSLQFRRESADRPGAANADSLAALDSLTLIQIGLRLDPSADGWRIAAASELAGRNAETGMEKLARAVDDHSPYAAEAKLLLARLAVEKNRDAEAVAVLTDALRHGDGRAAIQMEAGRQLAVIGQYDRARQALDAAIVSAAPGVDKAAAYLERAAANYMAGRLAESGADARSAMAAQESDEVRLSAAGYLAAAPDGWYEAVRIGRDLLLRRPRNVDTMNTLGYALIQREQGLDEGFKILRQAVDIDPDYYPVVDSLGWAYYQFGDFEQALKFVGQANDQSKAENAEVLDHLGDVHWRMNRQKEAREAWKKALASRPEAFRRAELEQKIAHGLVKPAPTRRQEPTDGPARRGAAPNKI